MSKTLQRVNKEMTFYEAEIQKNRVKIERVMFCVEGPVCNFLQEG